MEHDMDTAKRTLAKATTWQVSGFAMMTLLGFLMTGSLATAGGFAVASTLIGTVSYVVHERVWAQIAWGSGRPV
ncbi:DUF2061 domain-containing protein [Candidatus Rhodobacter oscarellae]|uniref:DUF2061 domain-containing protein n=1 Tax=Candidatus Rhodobacter oscarellae TaxID=1675527 RepID=UPI002E0D2175